MKLFKANITDDKAYQISQNNFEFQTRRRTPNYQNSGGKAVYYAVCPACVNPIQIIGLYTPSKHTEKPFGKHVKKTIRKLAQYDQLAYDFCPYASHKLSLNKNQTREKITDREKRMLNQLVEHFDQVAYIFKEQTGIYLSKKLATDMLTAYKAAEGYLYQGANFLNVPWMFAYMSNNQKLWGRKITNPELKKLIESANSNISFNENGVLTTKAYSDINFWFTDHQRKNDANGDLLETMKLVISESSKNIVTKLIEFDHKFFQSLLHVPDEKRPRKEELVPLARNILGSLL
jgi:hypothetical protein